MALNALPNMGIMIGIVLALCQFLSEVAAGDSYLYWFLCLFTWRYLRFLINLVAFWCYSPARKPKSRPTYSPSRDVTVILPTVDPEGKGFRECLKTCADNSPAKIVIVTAGDNLYIQTVKEVCRLEQRYKSTKFVVDRTQVASKREQVALAVSHVETDISVMLDDRAFWGPHFLKTLLCPFEDPDVGVVGTNKRVRRFDGLSPWGRIWNMLGATYLMRHNFEIRATNTVDGGVFVVSARTCALRTSILRHPEFLPGYTNEKFFFGIFGPLNPDDDNYNTRFAVRHGWTTKIQYTDETVMETASGTKRPVATKFLGQCRRWARTTWRSNLCSLTTDRSVWVSQPYCVYAVYLTSLTNFAAITDPLLIYLFTRSSAHTSPATLACLVSWILFTKLTKIFPYFRDHPQDIWLFPAYLAFAYFHSLIKLWALLTFWNCSWSGRRLDKIKVNATPISNPSPPPSTSIPTPMKQSPLPLIDTAPRLLLHQHRATIRALRIRIEALHTQHTRHINQYQLPLLTELQNLHKCFNALQRAQQDMRGNQIAIHAELRKVTAQAREVGSVQAVVAADEAEVGVAVEGLGGLAPGVEERWVGYRSADGILEGGEVGERKSV